VRFLTLPIFLPPLSPQLLSSVPLSPRAFKIVRFLTLPLSSAPSSPHLLSSAPLSPQAFKIVCFLTLPLSSAPPSPHFLFKCTFEPHHDVPLRLFFSFLGRSLITMRPFLGQVTYYNETLSFLFPV